MEKDLLKNLIILGFIAMKANFQKEKEMEKEKNILIMGIYHLKESI